MGGEADSASGLESSRLWLLCSLDEPRWSAAVAGALWVEYKEAGRLGDGFCAGASLPSEEGDSGVKLGQAPGGIRPLNGSGEQH